MQADRFNRVLAAESASNFGSMLSRLALPWLAALVLQATPLQMAALLVADVAAAALGSLLLGGWVDRHGKRFVMLWADGLRCALLALLALATWRGVVSFTLLLAAAAASGVLTVGFELARSAWLAQRIDARDLPRRNAQLSVAGSLSEAAAFGAGGWLYQGLGAALALAVDAASYAASALCLRGVPEAQAPRSAPLAMSGAIPVAIPGAMSGATSAATSTANSPTAPWRALAAEVADGLRAIAARPPLRALAGIEALLSFGMALTGTSIMIFVSRDLGLPTGQLGMIFAFGGVGAVLGASLAPRLGRRFGPGRGLRAAGRRRWLGRRGLADRAADRR